MYNNNIKKLILYLPIIKSYLITLKVMTLSLRTVGVKLADLLRLS